MDTATKSQEARSYKLIGARKIVYMGSKLRGENCNFEKYKKKMTKWEFYLTNEEGENFVLHMKKKYGQCYSGWTTATWGIVELSELTKSPNIELVPILGNMKVEYVKDKYRSDYFRYSEDGGDDYYPKGYIEINEEMFGPSYMFTKKAIHGTKER